MSGYTGASGGLGENVPVFCWCGQYTVDATLTEIRAGLTNPCRDRDCKAIDAEKRRKS